ncbi:hypothetical protein [Pedobacter frigiditerrae]|uniref:hypothetical protein n=1 Tax=Pedobacter frigiditerrae TaxID=2530452 RepID=UPI00292F9E5E|nr:hypothetical protein [Pedobacter frigiditerrae]
MKNNKRFSMAGLRNVKPIRKNYFIIFSLILLGLSFNSCKKDLLVPRIPSINDGNQKIKTISYTEFLNSINLNNTGSLKTTLSNAAKGNQGAIMNVSAGSNGFNISTDSIKRLTLGDTISYVISLKPETRHAVQFRNLTIQVLNDKTTAFLTTYVPTQEWVKDWKSKKHLGFKGEIYANKIDLSDIPKINGLNSSSQGSKGTTMSQGNATSEISINHNTISLAPGECEEYDVYETVMMPCKNGHYSRWDCNYQDFYGDWNIVEGRNDWPPYDALRYVGTALNCAPGVSTPPTSGGGGSTTPNPPGDYDPCDGEVPSVSYTKSGSGLKLAVVPPSPCDEDNGGLYPLPTNPIDDGFHQRSETVFNVEFERNFTYGEIEDFYVANPNAILAIIDENDYQAPASNDWIATFSERIILEYNYLWMIHQDWDGLKLVKEATWNVIKDNLHFALDVIGMAPVGGEAADILNGAIYYLEGDYINAALSGGSAIPVYGWFATGGKWVRTSTKVLTKPLSNAAGKLAYRAFKSSNGAVRFVKVAVGSFSHAILSGLKGIKPADNTLTNLSKTLIDQAGHRVAPISQTLKNKVDNIIQNGDQSGAITESLCDDIFETNGFVKFESKIGSNNGFDGVYIKKDGAGNVQEIFINEAKQVGSKGNIKLNVRTPNKGPQMSEEWIGQTINEMIANPNTNVLGMLLNNNRNKITKTVTGVDKASSEIVILKLKSY